LHFCNIVKQEAATGVELVRGSSNVFRDLGRENAVVEHLKAVMAAEQPSGESTYNEISQMPDYVTVYQISSGTSGLPFALLGLVPFAVGLVLIAGKWRPHWRRPNWPFPLFVCAFGIVWI
jgi:hypothetical protein